MSEFEKLASTRRSIRKFVETDIPVHEIEGLIKIATAAPSGCNSQCWQFAAIKDKGIISSIAAAVQKRVEEIFSNSKQEVSEEYLNSKRKMLTFFTKAPIVVAVFMTRLNYYDPTLISALKAVGHTDESIMSLFANPDLLSIGAAIQNLLLAVHEKGYGACWMNEPAIAGEEIREILGMPKDNRLISLIPIGVPAYSPRDKKMKPFEEVFRVI